MTLREIKLRKSDLANSIVEYNKHLISLGFNGSDKDIQAIVQHKAKNLADLKIINTYLDYHYRSVKCPKEIKQAIKLL